MRLKVRDGNEFISIHHPLSDIQRVLRSGKPPFV
jgi:hypothetical protein